MRNSSIWLRARPGNGSISANITRPFGLDQPAAPLVAQGIEELGRLGAADRPHTAAGTRVRRAALYPVALTMTGVSYALGGARHARKMVRAARA